MSDSFRPFLSPGSYIDSDHPAVISFANRVSADRPDPAQKAIALFYAVRDGWRYNPYHIDLRPEAMRASSLLQKNSGYCIEKANLLAAAARALNIPARLGFANVRNHIGTEKIERLLKTDILVFHGYTELFIEGRWVKATPAFNRTLCEKLNVSPLEFDARNDAVFQQFAADGTRFMEYLLDYGNFADLPREKFIDALKHFYPHLFDYFAARESLVLRLEEFVAGS